MKTVCVDASFALAAVLPEDKRPEVRRIWSSWEDLGVEPVAPWLFAFETQAVLRRKVAARMLRLEEARLAWDNLLGLGVKLEHHERLWIEAWDLAERYARPTTYDAVYVALARLLSGELWTMDRTLITVMGKTESYLRTV